MYCNRRRDCLLDVFPQIYSLLLVIIQYNRDNIIEPIVIALEPALALSLLNPSLSFVVLVTGRHCRHRLESPVTR
jgi:hypothetical protein